MFCSEMTFFQKKKKAPAAKLSHKQNKFSASPEDGIGSRQEQEQEQEEQEEQEEQTEQEQEQEEQEQEEQGEQE